MIYNTPNAIMLTRLLLIVMVGNADKSVIGSSVSGIGEQGGAAAGSWHPKWDSPKRGLGHQVISEGSNPRPANASGFKTREVFDFTKSFHVGTSCHDLQTSQGASRSGIYLVHPPNLLQGPWRVYCDQETEGGGWTVFQVRDDVEPHENFMRGWEDYKVGFGDFDREFWLGNILLWALTNTNNTTRQELHIELVDWSGNRRFARYRDFRVGAEEEEFRLHHNNVFFGNAGDALFSHNGLPFSTFDRDNDERDGDYVEKSCARLYKGAWWYGNCHDSNLNGWYLGGPHRSFADGVNWYTWTGYNYSLKRTIMKFRPQRSGPIPVGYDTYIMTNQKRSLVTATSSRPQQRMEEEEKGKEMTEEQPSARHFLFSGNPRSVPELLSSQNTLTREANLEL